MDNLHFENENFRGLTFEESEEVSVQPAIMPDNVMPRYRTILSAIVAREEERKKKKGVRKIKKDEYDNLINELQDYGEEYGFKDDDLLMIWKLISSQTTSLNCTQRRNMIFLMLPEKRVGHLIIETILYWLKLATQSGCKPTVLIAVYQLLNLYLENWLVEDSEFIAESTVNCVLTAPTENFVIPWKMRLVKNLTTPEILTLVNKYDVKKLLESQDIKKTQIDDIHSTLGVFKHMRPDLCSGEVIPPWKSRTLNFPKDAGQRFYGANLRIQQLRTAHHRLEDKIFPEFLPDCNASSARKTRMVELLECLESPDKTATLFTNHVLLQVFEDWLKPMIIYRFDLVSGVKSEEDMVRFEFILGKIYDIVTSRRQGLKDVNDWVLDILRHWDFWIFRDIIFKLLEFIPPEDVLRNRERIAAKFYRQFEYSQGTRIQIWKVLESWFFGWIEVSIEGEGDESSLQDDTEDARVIVNHMWDFKSKLPQAPDQMDLQKEGTRIPMEQLIFVLECVSKPVVADQCLC